MVIKLETTIMHMPTLGNLDEIKSESDFIGIYMLSVNVLQKRG